MPQLFKPREIAVNHAQVFFDSMTVSAVMSAYHQVLLRGQMSENTPAFQRLNDAQLAYLHSALFIDSLAVPLNAAVHHLTFFNSKQAGYSFERRGLAGAVGSQQSHHRAVLHG